MSLISTLSLVASIVAILDFYQKYQKRVIREAVLEAINKIKKS